MAGIAALMSRSRKEKERKRNASLHDETGFSEVIPGKDGPNISTPESKLKKSPASIRAAPSRPSLSIVGKKGSQLRFNNSLDDGPFGSSLRQSYTPVYIGLVLFAIGMVISFVGLGEKGFKTIELKLIGPILCTFGFLCIFFKILQCTFPRLLKCPRWLRKARLRDSDKANLMEKGKQNGHVGNSGNSLNGLSPRVTLQSTRKTPRPPSTIPNYIEDSSEDDFDPGRSRPHSNRNNSLEPKSEILLTPANLML